MTIIKELLDGNRGKQIEEDTRRLDEYSLGKCRAEVMQVGAVTRTDIMTPEGEVSLLFKEGILTNISVVASGESQERYVVMQSFDYVEGKWKQVYWSTLSDLYELEPGEKLLTKSELPENLDIAKTSELINEMVELMKSTDPRVKKAYQTVDPFKIRSLLVVQA